MNIEYSVTQQSNQGGRDYNEDSTAVFERHNSVLLVVADGLGGHAGGDLASQTFVKALGESFKKATDTQLDNSANFLTLSINYAHHMIHRHAVSQGFSVDSPKTTCVVCLIHSDIAIWAHSGDSRLYLIQKRDIVHVTEDHVSKRDPDNANSPINRCVGGLEPPRPHISEPHELEAGDTFVLATDGAWASFEVDDLRDYVDPEHPSLGLDSLLQTLENRNKAPSDNLSMVLLYWGVRQLDKPSANDFDHDERVTLVNDSKNESESDDENEPEKFDIANLDNAIVEIESFISELDNKI